MRESRRVWLAAVGAVVLLPALAVLDASPAQETPRAPAAPGEPKRARGSSESAERVAYLGVQLDEETEHPDGGARVTGVVEDSPAEKAGLESGDVVVEFAGVTIRGPSALTRQIHAKAPGDKVKIRVVRDGDERTIEAELGDRAKRVRGYAYPLDYVEPQLDQETRGRIERGLRQLEAPRVYNLAECGEGRNCAFGLLWGGRPRLGVELVETTPELRRHLGSEDESGVLVGKVLRGMPAEHAGMHVGDLIVKVADEGVTSIDELREALGDRGGDTFSIRVIRDKKAVDIEVTLPEDEDGGVTGPQAWLLTPPAPLGPPAPPAVPAPPARVYGNVAPLPPPVRLGPSQPVPPAPIAPAPPVAPAPPRRSITV
jgi:membrane-associated protease RseP (regulator of RpoE activity)